MRPTPPFIELFVAGDYSCLTRECMKPCGSSLETTNAYSMTAVTNSGYTRVGAENVRAVV